MGLFERHIGVSGTGNIPAPSRPAPGYNDREPFPFMVRKQAALKITQRPRDIRRLLWVPGDIEQTRSSFIRESTQSETNMHHRSII